ncbi:MotA/TolQ/ExbB proton channel family protein [Niastella sp. OAS944]|uniref:MotA/TolQ/ExbB proton channel family protein n=1 Tax=Niastella sp. OAS944 TaxID=2664089 RepID=UPI00346BF9D4|nr:hypothetical protein [Chitinophagaceae bacterium OAS944]
MHFIILICIILVQVWVLLRIVNIGGKIKYLFPDLGKKISVKKDSINGLSINIESDVLDMQILKNEINDCLKAHHINERPPDITQLLTMARDRSRIYDGKAGVLVTVPILLGLAGTIIGLGWAFYNIDVGGKSEELDFLSAITHSAAIAFVGTLGGILVTIGSATYISACKRERDKRLNWFCTNMNTYLAVVIPTIKDQTAALIASSMFKFSEEYFKEFARYTQQFRDINKELAALFDNELKETIKQNNTCIHKLNEYIDRLDNLYTVTKGITFKPAMVNEFAKAAGDLVTSLQSATTNHNENTAYLSGILEAYKNLENRVSANLIDLVKQKAVFGNFEEAVNTFVTDGKNWMADFSEVSKGIGGQLKDLSATYINTMGRIRDKLILQVESNFSSEGYKDFAQQIISLQSSVKKELDNIKLLSYSIKQEFSNIKQLTGSLDNLTNALSDSLVPSIQITSKNLVHTTDTLNTVLPNAIERSVEKHRDTIIETSERLMNKPRSWGTWTFKIATYLIPKRFKRNGRRTSK